MAKVWIANETYKEINSNSIITGSNKVGDIDQVAILSGSGAKGITINQAEVYHFAGNSTDFMFKNVKGVMEVYSKDGVTLLAKFAVTPGAEGENLKFNDGSFTAKMAADGGNNVVLHGKAGSTGSQILVSDVPTPAILDKTVVTIDPEGKSHEAGSGGDIPTPGPGTTFTLTAAVDKFTGTAADEIFNAAKTTMGGMVTLTAGDTLDGGLGNDTLNAELPGGVAATTLDTVRVKNIEKINFFVGDTVLAKINHWEGVESVNITSSVADKNVTLTSKAKEVSVLGGSGVNVYDTASSGSTIGANLTTLSVEGAASDILVIGKSIANINLTNLTADAKGLTVTNATAGHELNLTLNNVKSTTTGAANDFDLADSVATTVNIATTGLESAIGTGVFAKATALNINADEALTIGNITNTAASATLKNITITGDSLVTVSAMSNVGALETIDASGMTAGGAIFTSALGTGVTFKGGAGNDSIKIGATTKAISMGAGDDTVIYTAPLGVGGSVDGGSGWDTLDMGAAAPVAPASGITNFEEIKTSFGNTISISLGGSNPFKGLWATGDGVAGSGFTVSLTGTDTQVTLGGGHTGAAGTSGSDAAASKAAAAGIELKMATDSANDVTTLEFALTAGKTIVGGAGDAAASGGANVAVDGGVGVNAAGIETLNITLVTQDATGNYNAAISGGAGEASADNLAAAAGKGLLISEGATINISSDLNGFTSYDNLTISDIGVAKGFGSSAAGPVKGVTVDAHTFGGTLTLTASDLADTITGGFGTNALAGGLGRDKIDISLSTTKADTVSLKGITSANDGDTVTGFVVGTGATADEVVLGTGDVSHQATGAAAMQVISTAPFGDITFATGTSDVLELDFALGAASTGKNLATSPNGTALLALLTDAGTSLAAATSGSGYIVAYQQTTEGTTNAYLYHAVNDGTAALTTAEITLVGVFEGVAQGGFEAGNFKFEA